MIALEQPLYKLNLLLYNALIVILGLIWYNKSIMIDFREQPPRGLSPEHQFTVPSQERPQSPEAQPSEVEARAAVEDATAAKDAAAVLEAAAPIVESPSAGTEAIVDPATRVERLNRILSHIDAVSDEDPAKLTDDLLQGLKAERS
jgi:hypothetical protein